MRTLICGFIVCCSLLLNINEVRAQMINYGISSHKQLTEKKFKKLKHKISKNARREAKRFEKEGWRSGIASMSIEEQLEQCYFIQNEVDEKMRQRYFITEGVGADSNYDTAKMQAEEFAKSRLSAQLKTQIASTYKNTETTQMINNDVVTSVTTTDMTIESHTSCKIKGIYPVLEVYRILGDNTYEVLVRMTCEVGNNR